MSNRFKMNHLFVSPLFFAVFPDNIYNEILFLRYILVSLSSLRDTSSNPRKGKPILYYLQISLLQAKLSNGRTILRTFFL